MPACNDHMAFVQPQDPSVKVWRYMDFTKFVSMLDSSSLFFCRSDRLGDPFEGSYSRGNLNLRPLIYKDVPGADHMIRTMALASKKLREYTFINCWHMNEHESAAMWKLYAKSNEAVAIQSSYTKLVNCLPENVFVGCVQYIDYDRDWLPEGNMFYPFLHKRRSFEHEREFRAIIQVLPDGNHPFASDVPNPELGHYVNIQLLDQVEEIYVAPTAPAWFANLVGSVSLRYGHQWRVRRSSLDTEPVY